MLVGREVRGAERQLGDFDPQELPAADILAKVALLGAATQERPALAGAGLHRVPLARPASQLAAEIHELHPRGVVQPVAAGGTALHAVHRRDGLGVDALLHEGKLVVLVGAELLEEHHAELLVVVARRDRRGHVAPRVDGLDQRVLVGHAEVDNGGNDVVVVPLGSEAVPRLPNLELGQDGLLRAGEVSFLKGPPKEEVR